MSDRVQVTWLGHSTVVLDIAGGDARARLVTDPLLLRHAGLLRRRGARPDRAWRGADAVLLSHLHHDHAELGSLRLLPQTPVLTAPQNAHWLRSKGLVGVGVGDDWMPVGVGVEVRLVPAVHKSRPMPHRPNGANGHLVRWRDGESAATVWVAGDTGDFEGLERLSEWAGGPIDLALVPVGGWGPRLSGGHLGPAAAARVCARVGARTAVPVHWGTLHAPGGRNFPRGWMDRAGIEFAAEVARSAPGTRAVVLAPGESARLTVDRTGVRVV